MRPLARNLCQRPHFSALTSPLRANGSISRLFLPLCVSTAAFLGSHRNHHPNLRDGTPVRHKKGGPRDADLPLSSYMS